MPKPDMEQLEAGVSTLIEVCRRLKDENDKLTLQMEGLIQKGESLTNEKEFINNKLERISDLEMKNKNNENTKKQIREKVANLLEKLENFDLT
jgi:predicted RNase H-like nuclease (RuvC/YqgF family)